MASSALEEKINKIRQQNEEIRRRYEVHILLYDKNFIYIYLYALRIISILLGS